MRGARQSSSARSQARPVGRRRPALEVRERRVVGRDHPRPRAGLDRHVADRHPALHRERCGSRRRRTRARARPPPATPSRPIAPRITSFAVTPGGSVALEADAHRPRPRLRQALRRQHVLDLRRADAERERAERAVRRRVAVAADDRHSRLRQPRARARSRARSPRGRCPVAKSGTPNSAQLRRSASSCAFASGSVHRPVARSARCGPSSRATGRAAARPPGQPQAVERLRAR